ncbi:MAG: serine/threonine-protein phosphatase [Anaerolineae bacterium]|nr:serine/threonine-protein phosphatase [Anaerolineae bacterium]
MAVQSPYEVHLINLQTQQHSILQLNAAMEQADPSGSGRSVAFRFQIGDPSQMSAAVVLERISGGGVLLVDGRPVLDLSPVAHGSVITINSQQYRLELVSTEQPSQPPSLRANWLSITGSYRDHNEDAIGISDPARARMFVLCDGVGGAEAGEAVSQFAIQQMLTMFHQHSKGSGEWLALMNQALVAINTEVRRNSRMLSEQRGTTVMMGSTMVSVVLQGWDAFILHVGDSRLYHWRSGQIRQVTNDHSTFMDDIYARMGEGASGTMPGISLKRNVLVRGIGKSDTIEPDLIQFRLAPGDKLLLCSDGMSDKIGLEEVGAALRDMRLEDLPGYLANTADTRVSKDNISVIIVESNLGGDAPPIRPPAQERAYLGYNGRWPKSLDSAVAAAVAPAGGAANGGSASSRGSSKLLIGAVAVVALLAVVAILAVVLGGQGGAPVAAQTPANATDPVAVVTEAVETSVPATATVTPDPTETPLPTDTATPAPTPTPTETPVPPTATLRTEPTATIRPG